MSQTLVVKGGGGNVFTQQISQFIGIGVMIVALIFILPMILPLIMKQMGQIMLEILKPIGNLFKGAFKGVFDFIKPGNILGGLLPGAGLIGGVTHIIPGL